MHSILSAMYFLIVLTYSCILNKADQVDRQKLMRIYGALMWSIGKVVKSPEVLRVYIGSFWDQPLVFDDNGNLVAFLGFLILIVCLCVPAALFEMEEKDLMRDLKDLPRNSAVRKINELVKRVRICKVHAYIIGHMKEQMPMMMGHAKKQKELIDTLPAVFRTVMKKYNLAPGDFPDIADFQGKLVEHDFTKFHSLKPKLIEDADQVLGYDFPRLMEALPRSNDSYATQASLVPRANDPLVYNNAPTAVAAAVAGPFGSAEDDDNNPWADEGAADEKGTVAVWALNEYIPMYTPQFRSVEKNGLVSGGAAKGVLGGSGLPVASLRKIWDLSDVDKDGQLDLQEFVIAMFLIDMAKKGHDLPAQLDEEMVPPQKRR
jgi:hypothetical protein